MLFSIPSKRVEFDDGDSETEIVAQPDLLPVPQNERTWNAVHLAGYWIAEAFGIRLRRLYAAFRCIKPSGPSQYQVASTSLQAGLSPGSAIGAVFLGHFLVSLACAFNGWVGATYGINFAIFARASFGTYGNVLAVMCRAIAAIVWFGTQSYQGGQCVEVMLRAVFPSFKSFENHIPPSAHVTSSELLCFFIFYLVQLPLLSVHISKLRHLFMLKVIIMACLLHSSSFVTSSDTFPSPFLVSHSVCLPQNSVGWAVGKAHGFGPIFSQKTDVSGSPVAVVFFSAMTAAIAPKATLALNICARLHPICQIAPRSRLDQHRLIIYPSHSLLGSWRCGDKCHPGHLRRLDLESATSVRTMEQSCRPIFCGFLLGTGRTRDQYFCQLHAVLQPSATILRFSFHGTSISDVDNTFAPFWAWPLVPGSSKIVQYPSRTSFLGGYSIFLGPICGILLADYYVNRRRKLNVSALYAKDGGLYWYTHGVNMRAFVAFILALIPNLPGFAATVNTKIQVPIGARYVFSLVWPVGAIVAATCYLLLNLVWPDHQAHEGRAASPSMTSDGDPEK
ncbi:hypothetical protein MSAN_02181100 [Mycena sanguinolenta]|uniref:Uncharacterized protein n=1 Tax=Mycena sanguinolenta TaxID=230812 RepID=A0A8H6XFQ4_9AGAR|nr:hypothetical protein MSAN_02181100 [Mycena sanguinolenta]